MKNILAILGIGIFILGSNSCSTTYQSKHNMKVKSTELKDKIGSKDYWVKNIGSRLSIINDGDFSSSIGLDELSNVPNLYAIGPIEGLKGEITVYDGKVSIATMENGQAKFTSNSSGTDAIFMVYGRSSKWKEIGIEKPLIGLDEIEQYVREQLLVNGLTIENTFPFRIEGQVSTLDYHIIYKLDNKPHNKVEHQKAKQKFNMENEDVSIVGFWADMKGEKVYTHPGHRTHIHFVQKDENISGHIDDIKLNKGAKLYLPLVK